MKERLRWKRRLERVDERYQWKSRGERVDERETDGRGESG